MLRQQTNNKTLIASRCKVSNFSVSPKDWKTTKIHTGTGYISYGFYDLMFLLSQAKPDYGFLSKRCGMDNLQEFKDATNERLKTVDPKVKQKDFEHLLFNRRISEKILRFGNFINALKD
ncbi:MAG: hypothetical protein QM610_08840 [Chitinophagaceae bacterium]